jgi:hypothetical protein
LVSGRTDHTAALLPNGKVLIAGGFNTSDTGPTTELYDPASAVATQALLSLTKLPGGTIQITFRNTPGQGFTVLITTDLAVPLNEWPSAGDAVETSPGHYQFTDTITANPHFYRVRSP